MAGAKLNKRTRPIWALSFLLLRRASFAAANYPPAGRRPASEALIPAESAGPCFGAKKLYFCSGAIGEQSGQFARRELSISYEGVGGDSGLSVKLHVVLLEFLLSENG